MTYDGIDDIPWDELPDDFWQRDIWIQSHCSDKAKAQIVAEFEKESAPVYLEYQGLLRFGGSPEEDAI